MIQSNRLTLSAVVASVCFLVTGAFADSQARMVRLSDVQGDVKIDRNAGLGVEKAFLNLPVTQGAKIETKSGGRAEIEFEDGSTLRLAPDTLLSFSQLSLHESGAKVSTLHLDRGTAYINLAGSKADEFTLNFGRETLTLQGATRLRIEMDATDASVAVFKGDAAVSGPSGSAQVSKNHTVNFDLIDKDKYVLARGVDPAPFDDWDKEQDQYHQRYQAANSSAMANSQYAYGTSDLNYYGSYFDAPGYGTLWQPYLAGAGWDPFMSGAWAFYPGAGYAWVSGYPWGWTPYHSGSWLYVPSYGWGWQPGNNWSGWSLTGVRNAPAGFQMPQPPVGSGRATVLVSRGPEPSLLGKSPNKLSIPQNSAGLGIPRGAVRDFSDLSHSVQKTGFAHTTLHVQPVGNGMGYQMGWGPRGSGPRPSGPWQSGNSSSRGAPSGVSHSSMGGARVSK